jgi:hypothetical protein
MLMAVSRFQEAWQGKELDPPLRLQPPAETCAYAQALEAFGAALCTTLWGTPAKRFEDALIDAKARLADRWFETSLAAPQHHTNAAGKRAHRCCDAVLKDQMAQLRELARLTLPPPRLGSRREEDEDESPYAFGIEIHPGPRAADE